jgi:glutamine---fructose-6-phosphate transaminase (isomerizing)
MANTLRGASEFGGNPLRCARCVMLDQIPGSDFDEQGVCSWCRSGYPNYRPVGVEALWQVIHARLRPDSEADCIVGISGGKDSCFALWALKKKFGLRVEAFTYDHDGVTKHARENVRDVCSALDVPLHVFSLGAHRHLNSFKDYFAAFLTHPSPVTAGMTCVACKHLHVFGSQLAAKKRAPFAVWAKCPLEDSPFLALKPRGNGTQREGLLKGGVLLVAEILKSWQFLSAITRHFALTLEGCLSFTPSSSYLRLRYPSVEQLAFFEYWPWNPSEIYETLFREAGWRKPQDVESDWHSDCIFNVFKEFLFQSLLGVSYTDGFLSNQIRAGLLSRDQGLLQLAESKLSFAQALPKALEQTGLSHLASKVNLSCFAVAEK